MCEMCKTRPLGSGAALCRQNTKHVTVYLGDSLTRGMRRKTSEKHGTIDKRYA